MLGYVFRNKVGLGIIFGLILAVPSTDAFARGEFRLGSSRNKVVVARNSGRQYSDYRFYREGFFGLNFFIGAPAIGAIVKVLPFGHNVIVVRGSRYYHHNNVYYTGCPSGYVVVPASVVYPNVVTLPSANQYQELSSGNIIINVLNPNGSYTGITLTRHNNGYVGPQGEYYTEHPSLDQLRVLYGK